MNGTWSKLYHTQPPRIHQKSQFPTSLIPVKFYMKLRNTIASTASTGREKMQAKGRESTKFMGPPQRSFPNILFPA
jgi:hypothetical protein